MTWPGAVCCDLNGSHKNSASKMSNRQVSLVKSKPIEQGTFAKNIIVNKHQPARG
jgi:hypothetical protein